MAEETKKWNELDAPPEFMSQEAIDEFLKQHPAEVVSTEPAYSPMNPETEGAWKMAFVSGEPVALIWTDWVNGAGVVAIGSSAESDSLYKYIVTNKRMNAQAGVAYSTAHHVEGYTFGEEQTGPLGEAMSFIDDTIKRETSQ